MLIGSKIALRPLEEEDLPYLVQWRNQDRVRRSFFHKGLLSHAGQRMWFERYLQDPSREIMIAVSLHEGNPVGMIGLYHIDHRNHKAEVGMTIVGDPSVWGQGIGTEMLELLKDYAFCDLNLNRLYAYAIDTNQASVRMKLKCGFQLEGTLREDHYDQGVYHDVYLLAITRSGGSGGDRG